LITGNKDIDGLRSPRAEGLDRKPRKTPPEVAGDGRDGYNVAQNRGSSGECRLRRQRNHGTKEPEESHALDGAACALSSKTFG